MFCYSFFTFISSADAPDEGRKEVVSEVSVSIQLWTNRSRSILERSETKTPGYRSVDRTLISLLVFSGTMFLSETVILYYSLLRKVENLLFTITPLLSPEL